MRFVIIGAGAAGMAAVQTLVKKQPDSEIVVVGEERYLPYYRYLLTEYLSGGIPEEKLFYLTPEFFEKHGIHFRKGQRVIHLRPQQKEIVFHHQEVVHYDRLLIATGGRPQLNPILEPYREHIQLYYTLEHAHLIREKISSVKRCVVSGEGLSTLDLLSGLHRLDKEIIYITAAAEPHFPVVESEFEGGIGKFLQEKGIQIITRDRIVAVEKGNGAFRVLTLNQREIETDMVFAWAYYQPNISLTRDTGIECRFGILVDQHFRTSVPDIFAAGDCVEIYHPELRSYWINFGWPNATRQGELAALNMLGEEIPYEIQTILTFNLMGRPLKARWWE